MAERRVAPAAPESGSPVGHDHGSLLGHDHGALPGHDHGAPFRHDHVAPLDEAYGAPIGRRDGLRHAGHPVQMLVRSRRHALQRAFAREAIARAGRHGDGWILQAGGDGLVVIGRTESALRAALEHVRHRYLDEARDAGSTDPGWHDGGLDDGGLDDGPVRIRRVAGEPPCEPVMQVLVRVPRPLRHAILRDLAERGAWSVRVNTRLAPETISACVRLADSVGYEARVERIAAGMAQVKMRLSHYAPEPDRLAAGATGRQAWPSAGPAPALGVQALGLQKQRQPEPRPQHGQRQRDHRRVQRRDDAGHQ